MPNLVRVLRLVALAVVVGIVALLGVRQALADTNIGVSIGVGDTNLTINGLASPQAFVSIRDGSAVVGTGQADATGAFSINLLAQNPGNHQYVIAAEDTNNILTDSVSLFISLAENAHSTAHVFLPPSLLMPSSVAYGQAIHINGSTIPSATVSVVVDGHTNQVVADSNGLWSFNQPSNALGSGTHVVFVFATSTTSETSYDSDLHTVEVGSNPNQPQPPAPAPPSPVPPSIETPISRPTSPVITYPPANAQLPNGVNEIRGRAEPGRIINVYNGKQLIGSTVADANGNWALRVSLDGGSYELFAQACDSNSVCSSLSNGVPFSVKSAQSPVAPLLVSLDPYAQKTSVDSRVSLKITTNQAGSYRLKVVWDDGQTDSVTASSATTNVTHIYHNVGLFAGTVWVETNGQVAVASFSVTVTSQPVFNNALAIAIVSVLVATVVAITVVGVSSLIFGGPLAAWNWLVSLIKRLLRLS